MKKQFLIISFFFIICRLFAQSINTSNATTPSPYEPDVLKAFADSLYNDGFLTQAEGEYKRFIFSLSEEDAANTNTQSSFLALTNIYRRQQNVSGINWLNDNFYSVAQNQIKEKINFVRAEFIFKERNAQDFELFSTSISSERNLFSTTFNNLIDTSSFVLSKDIDGLKLFCPTVASINPDYEKLNELCQSYKLKSPGLALFFSTVIPGSGKWYTGSFGAFVSSFLTIGSFAAGTVITGIQTEWKSWQPYVFGACGAVIYIAELYGAYQSAKRYNAALYRVLCEETEKLYEKEY